MALLTLHKHYLKNTVKRVYTTSFFFLHLFLQKNKKLFWNFVYKALLTFETQIKCLMLSWMPVSWPILRLQIKSNTWQTLRALSFRDASKKLHELNWLPRIANGDSIFFGWKEPGHARLVEVQFGLQRVFGVIERALQHAVWLRITFVNFENVCFFFEITFPLFRC